MAQPYKTKVDDIKIHCPAGAPTGWCTLPSGIEVTALSLVDASQPQLLAHIDYDMASAFAAQQGAELIHYETVDELHMVARAAGNELEPNTLPDSELVRQFAKTHGPRPADPVAARAWDVALYRPMSTLEWCQRADAKIFADLERIGWNGAAPVANDGKHFQWGAPKGRCYIRGWWVEKQKHYIQAGVPTTQVGKVPGPHLSTQFDYGTTTRLQRRPRAVVQVNGLAAAAADTLFVEAQRTPSTIAELYEALAGAWTAVAGGTPSRESLLVIMAHWGIETGDGVACWNWNIGNAKRVAGSPWTMLHHVVEKIGGTTKTFEPPDPQTHFRAFSSLAEGAKAYLADPRIGLMTRFAQSWPAVVAGDPVGFAHALKAQHYYTADEHAYAEALEARVRAFSHHVPAAAAVPSPQPRTATEVVHGYRCSVWELVADARALGSYHPKSSGYVPKAGDLIISGRLGQNPEKPQHSGHVELAVEDAVAGSLRTLGGNESNTWVEGPFNLLTDKDHVGCIERGPLGAKCIEVAREELARRIREVPGAGAHPRISEYHAGARRGGSHLAGMVGHENEGASTLGLHASDEIAWCASGASFCTYQAAKRN